MMTGRPPQSGKIPAALLKENVSYRHDEYLKTFCMNTRTKSVFLTRNEWMMARLAGRFALHAQHLTGAHLITVDMARAAQEKKTPLTAILEALQRYARQLGLPIPDAGTRDERLRTLCKALQTPPRDYYSGSPILFVTHFHCCCTLLDSSMIGEFNFLRDIPARLVFTTSMNLMDLEAGFLDIGQVSILAPLTDSISVRGVSEPYRIFESEQACQISLSGPPRGPRGSVLMNGGACSGEQHICQFRADGTSRSAFISRDPAALAGNMEKFVRAAQTRTQCHLISLDMARAAARGQTPLDAVLEALEGYAASVGVTVDAADRAGRAEQLCRRLVTRSVDHMSAEPILHIRHFHCCLQTTSSARVEEYDFLRWLPARVVLSSAMTLEELERCFLPPDAAPILPPLTDVITLEGDAPYTAAEADQACRSALA